MDLTERLERCYTGVLNDVMRGMGLRNFVLPPEIRPLFPERPLAGPVWTVSGHVDEAADRHTTLFEWTGLLAKARPGHVIVCQPHTHAVALMGELSAETLKNKGVLGCYIDGLARDVDFLLKMKFQTWCSGFTPRDIVGYWLPKGFDTPIRIGDVVVEPGDYMVADRDGAVRIPKGIVADVVAKAEEAVATENKVRSAILAGLDPQEAYLKYGKF